MTLDKRPTCLLYDPGWVVGLEAVVWLEDYLSKWKKMLFMVCHSQVRRAVV